MQITLEIENDLYDDLVNKGVDIQSKIKETLFNLVDDGYPGITTAEAKRRVSDAVESYRNGTMKTVSNDEMWQRIDKHTKAD